MSIHARRTWPQRYRAAGARTGALGKARWYVRGIAVPVDPAPWSRADPDVEWATLTPDAKRERILRAAGWVFSRDGLDAPIPLVADAAGAGVGSVYRQFSSKRELLAALVTRRLQQTESAATLAAESPGSRWEALVEMLWTIVERQSGDDFLGEAMTAVEGHPEVVAARERTTAALGRLLQTAREEGRLRADATTHDITLLFAATRAAKHAAPDSWRRMLRLLIDGLAAAPPRRLASLADR